MTAPSNPRVSIIVPNYNHAPFLRQRLESIYAQTFRDYEVILLDDNSTDNSQEILHEYSNRANTQLFLNTKNSGSTFAQWNKGVKLAAGDLIWIAESDDDADPAFLNECIATLDTAESIGLVYANSWMIDKHGEKIESRSSFIAKKLNEPEQNQDFIRDGCTEVVTRMIKWNTIPNASGVVFKKKYYVDAGGADENMTLAGDWLMWIKILKKCEFGYVAAPLNYNRTHPETLRSKMGNNLTGLYEKITVLRYVLENFPLQNNVTSQVLNTLAGKHQIESIRRATLVNARIRDYLDQVDDDELLTFSSAAYILVTFFKRILRRVKAIW